MARMGVREPRPARAVVLRALVAGAGLGPVFALAVILLLATSFRAPRRTDLILLAVVVAVGAISGALVALVSAAAWLMAVYGGLGRWSDLAAGVVAVLVCSPLWFGNGAHPGWILLTGAVAAVVARWQGYVRPAGQAGPVRPTSSPAG